MQQRIRVICCCLVTQFCPTLFQPHGLQLARFLCPRDLPGKTIGVGCHFLLQEICPIRGSNQCLLHWQADSSLLSQQFPQFIGSMQSKALVNKAEIDVFQELLLFRWSSACWQFDLWFLCLFWIQLEHLEVHGSHIAEAWLEEFWALLY